jgi:hypothetical protein
MKRLLCVSSCLILLILSLNSITVQKEIIIDDFNNGMSPEWKEKVFEGKTEYSIANEDNVKCIKAISNSSASALLFKIDYDLKEYPVLSWQWKIDHVLKKGNALKKEGDDYAARVYVVFPSILIWRTKAINYIWSSKLPKGESVPNPFTGNAIMIAIESGEENAGKWVNETRNVLQDYRNAFGKEPPKAGAIAIMTDTDNTGEAAIAWYGPIRILSEVENQ